MKINRHMTFLLKMPHQIPFGDVVIVSNCTVSNRKVTDNLLSEKDLEGNDCGIFGVLPYILESNPHPNLIRTSFCRFLK